MFIAPVPGMAAPPAYHGRHEKRLAAAAAAA
jgi:hypothetical protein